MKVSFAFLVVTILTIASANAQPLPSKTVKMSFGDELVAGTTEKPDLQSILARRKFNYKRLIQLRDNFVPEVRRASESVSKRKAL